MRRSIPIVILGVALAATAAAIAFRVLDEPAAIDSPPPAPYDGDGPRLVVLVVVDTLRKDSLSVYNPDASPTPGIDALAAESTTYTNAVAPSSWTSPSMASIMTGLLPTELGVQHELRRLSAEATLLPELFHDAGYTTAGVVSNKYCSVKWGFGQGYDEFDESLIKPRTSITSDQVTDHAIAMLDAHADTPLFLTVHYIDPHVAYQEHEDFVRYEGDYDGILETPVTWVALREARRTMPESDWERMRSIYASEVAWTDHHVGRLFEHLRTTDRFDDALIVFTHDHGEEFDDHNSIGHGYSLYEELVAAPLIIHYPGDAPATVDAPVSLMDIVPTALAASGIAPPPHLQGQDLRTPVAPDRVIRTETDRGGNPVRGVRIGDRMLIHNASRRTRYVYDLTVDPTQTGTVEATQADQDLLDALEDWPDPVFTAEAEPIDLDSVEREMLEALGYLEGDEP